MADKEKVDEENDDQKRKDSNQETHQQRALAFLRDVGCCEDCGLVILGDVRLKSKPVAVLCLFASGFQYGLARRIGFGDDSANLSQIRGL